jgi:hypothetical protein
LLKPRRRHPDLRIADGQQAVAPRLRLETSDDLDVFPENIASESRRILIGPPAIAGSPCP